MAKPLSSEQRQEWAEKIQAQRASGLSVDRWCKNNQIASHVFYYWKQRLFPQPPSQGCFTELVDQQGCSIDIECQGSHIRIESPTLKQAFHILKGLKC